VLAAPGPLGSIDKAIQSLRASVLIRPLTMATHPIGMSQLGCFGEVETIGFADEKIGLESVVKQIGMTVAMAHMAKRLYRLDATGDADRFFAKAWEAYYKAVDQLGLLSIPGERRDHLAAILKGIRFALHSLSPF
jgi:hypothetical protein